MATRASSGPRLPTGTPATQPARPARLGQPVSEALGSSEALTGLLARLRESERRWAAVAPSLPADLAAGARAGPLDEKAWVILAEHASAAAKLRQCLPLIEQMLLQGGWHGPSVRIKVRPRA